MDAWNRIAKPTATSIYEIYDAYYDADAGIFINFDSPHITFDGLLSKDGWVRVLKPTS